MSKIVVIGSINLDIVAKVSHLPTPGETVGEGELFEAFGGKGANQAVAAAKTGGDVSFVGCVGSDSTGQRMIDNFNEVGIDTTSIKIVDDVVSGTALIFVDAKAENCIVVAPGANDKVTPEIIDSIITVIEQADLIVMQLEIPYKTVQYVCALAKKLNKKVMLNTAPGRELDNNVLSSLEYLIMNETEMEIITGKTLTEDNIESLCIGLQKLGSNNIIVTLGKRGSYVYTDKVKQFVDGHKVNAVDTTAAGDTYCGALATAILKPDAEIISAIKFANAAAALSVTKMGAQPSVPLLNEVENFMKVFKI